MYDLHAHSNYSDGRPLPTMVRAAEEAGLEGLGFADHCNVSPRERFQDVRAKWGFNLDRTYERRRRAIDLLRDETAIALYDAVELDYDPRDEGAIRTFLAATDFDYAIGSVHAVEGTNVQRPSAFEGLSEGERDAVVDRYFETLVALVESELFDVAAHPDLVERTPPLRARATTDHYRRAASAFADSRTVPEVNAGRAIGEDGFVHPAPEFLEQLREHDVPVAVGSDSHRPDEIGDRIAFLESFLAERGLEPVRPAGLE